MVWQNTVDDYGLTLPNNYLDLYFPGSNKSIVLYVKYRTNPNFNLINYGPFPTTSSTTFSVYNGVGGGTGGSATPTASGEIPAASYIKGLQFSDVSTSYFSGTFPFGPGDIWYTQDTTRVFEVMQYVTPSWLRVEVNIPTGELQELFQSTVSGGVDQDFGWTRGRKYAVHVPWIHYGYGYGNDSSVQVYSRIYFRYAEQIVGVVLDPAVVFNVINDIIPAHKVYMPTPSYSGNISGPLIQTYGYDGVPVMPRAKQQQAIAAYTQILSQVVVPGGNTA